MTRAEQVKICKICTNQKFDVYKGVICGLTNELATFEDQCKSFVRDEEAVKKALEEEKRKKLAEENDYAGSYISSQAESEKMIKGGANWFYWIAGLSLINSIIIYSGAEISFIVGLGITQFIDGIIYGLTGDYQAWGLIPNVLISGVFAVIGFFAHKYSKSAFITGTILYALDSLIFLMVEDFLSVGFHVFALVMIFRGFSQIKSIKPQDKMVIE